MVIGNTVYVGGFDSKLHAVDLASGTEKWTFDASYWVWNAPISDGNDIIFGDFNGRVYAVNQNDGSETWQISVGRGAIVGSPVLAQGTLVVATQDGWLVGIDPSTHEKKWETNVPTDFTANLVAVDNGSTVLIAPRGCVTPEGLDHKVYYYAVNPANGELKEAQNIC
jgi:outer membrane protein assembly factor BamB